MTSIRCRIDTFGCCGEDTNCDTPFVFRIASCSHHNNLDASFPQFLTAAYAEAKSKFGQIDIVCNNATVWDEEDWTQMMLVNIVSRGRYM